MHIQRYALRAEGFATWSWFLHFQHYTEKKGGGGIIQWSQVDTEGQHGPNVTEEKARHGVKKG